MFITRTSAGRIAEAWIRWAATSVTSSVCLSVCMCPRYERKTAGAISMKVSRDNSPWQALGKQWSWRRTNGQVTRLSSTDYAAPAWVCISTRLCIFSRASRMLRSATQVVRMPCVCHIHICMYVCMYVCGIFFPNNPYLQAGLTDLDEIWHDGRS